MRGRADMFVFIFFSRFYFSLAGLRVAFFLLHPLSFFSLTPFSVPLSERARKAVRFIGGRAFIK